MTNNINVTDPLINNAAKIIARGGLVAFPTETVYGLGADAFNAKAVARIFEIKQRPSFDPLIVHIASIDDLEKLTFDISKEVSLLAKKFWPGPLTMVLPKKKEVPAIVTAGLSTVAVRMPDHPMALKLIKASKTPIAAPSANKFGCISPTTAKHVKKQLTRVDCILDAGESTKIGIESTVLYIKDQHMSILRHGAVTMEEILEVVPHCHVIEHKESLLESPGMLKSHYSPSKPTFFLDDELPKKFKKEKGAVLSFSGRDIKGYKIVEQLTQKEDLKEYAANLFLALHRLEESDIEFIVAEPVPEKGLGLAIMDKLRKASYQYRKEILTTKDKKI